MPDLLRINGWWLTILSILPPFILMIFLGVSMLSVIDPQAIETNPYAAAQAYSFITARFWVFIPAWVLLFGIQQIYLYQAGTALNSRLPAELRLPDSAFRATFFIMTGLTISGILTLIIVLPLMSELFSNPANLEYDPIFGSFSLREDAFPENPPVLLLTFALFTFLFALPAMWAAFYQYYFVGRTLTTHNILRYEFRRTNFNEYFGYILLALVAAFTYPVVTPGVQRVLDNPPPDDGPETDDESSRHDPFYDL